MSEPIKVVLLGDSIRMNYGPRAAELLAPDIQVWQPEDNCRFIKYTLQESFTNWRQQILDCDIVHFNNGNWDISNNVGDGPLSTCEEYTMNILRAARYFKGLGKTVCFATTIPTRPEREITDNSLVAKYNESVVPLLKNEGVLIDDLYSLVNADVYKYIREDDLTHLNEAGIEACAQQVAGFICGVAAGIKK